MRILACCLFVLAGTLYLNAIASAQIRQLSAYKRVFAQRNGFAPVFVEDDEPGTISAFTFQGGASISASTTSEYTPYPRHASSAAGFGGRGEASSLIQFGMAVHGPSTDPVPILLHSHSSIQVSLLTSDFGHMVAYADAILAVFIFDEEGSGDSLTMLNISYVEKTVDDEGTHIEQRQENTFVPTSRFYMTTLQTAQIQSSVEAGFNTEVDWGFSGFAELDHYFCIDPSFPNADQYWLEISPGIGNQKPVPEPASLLTLIGGVTGLVVRRRAHLREEC